MPRVLVVDDEHLVSMMLADWLAELGCETLGPANTVAAALRLIDQAPVDAAILDVSLGNEQSYPVANELRRRRIPFAFATGHGAEVLAVPFKDAPLLSKPFEFRPFEAVVRTLVTERRRD